MGKVKDKRRTQNIGLISLWLYFYMNEYKMYSKHDFIGLNFVGEKKRLYNLAF